MPEAHESPYADALRLDAVEQVACEIVAGIRRAMSAHGLNDPLSPAIIICGIAMASREIEKKLYPDFQRVLAGRLLVQVESQP